MSEMYVVETGAAAIQGELFTFRMVKPSEGAVSLGHTKNIALPHSQTAELLNRADLGEGSVVSFTGGTGIIGKFTKHGGKAIWTVDVEDLEIEL